MSTQIEQSVRDLCRGAREASRKLARMSTDQKNAALLRIADLLDQRRAAVLEANARDVENARGDNLAAAMIDRLTLNGKRIDDMVEGARAVAGLPDPCWSPMRQWTVPTGLEITRMRVPIGVIGIIYEARPNVTVDAAVLCFKAGSACVLRGGKESFHSNVALAGVMREAFEQLGFPAGGVSVIGTTDRAAVLAMLRLPEYVDLVIPRGGEGLIRFVSENSLVPVIKHYKGVCHIYVDARADLDMAERICINAKVQRPGVCNAVEKILIHRDVARAFVPRLCDALARHGVEIRACADTCGIRPGLVPAQESDWTEEYLDLVVALKIVDGVDQAVDHINRHGSGHSDAIITADDRTAAVFLRDVDSATVYVNASTRFTDGAQFGFGAEIGISTDKIHARGPMALEELTTYKYLIRGTGQVRA